MRKILEWIKKRKLLTFGLCVLTFSLPLIVVHMLFKTPAINNWFTATWRAGELLAYVAGFETLLGTVVLGAITVYQSDKANEANERLSKENIASMKKYVCWGAPPPCPHPPRGAGCTNT